MKAHLKKYLENGEYDEAIGYAFGEGGGSDQREVIGHFKSPEFLGSLSGWGDLPDVPGILSAFRAWSTAATDEVATTILGNSFPGGDSFV